MEDNELDVIDILSYVSEDLEEKYKKANDVAAKIKVLNEYLNRWSDENDKEFDAIKRMKVTFQSDLDWFNVTKPLQAENLRGKLVLLDFFTYCCINCMHVLPELRRLEELYTVERGLVVIGVHSPKFENEKSSTNISAASQRYGIQHPIVNDPHNMLWRTLGIRCWPTLLMLSPNGYPIALFMGEGHGAFLEKFIEQALNHFNAKGKLESSALPLCSTITTTMPNTLPASRLSFPAKITRSDDGMRFAVADAGNNRVILFDRTGLVHQTFGGYVSGFVDGDATAARFNSPQGLTFLENDTLIVADTENHAIRKITISTGYVETLSGTGKQGNDRCGGKVGRSQELSSPWDVAVFRTRDMDMSFHLDEQSVPEKTIILIAMSGTHQIWGYFPDGIILWKFRRFEPMTCVALVGNGMEENRNNSYPQNAAFAQPSGITMAKNFLYIADSESSSIRKVSMLDGKVTGVVGGDRNPLNLFAYGDVDGKQYTAKLQHPLSVTYNSTVNRIYVADTYNHKIKMIDCTENVIKTVAITGDTTGTTTLFKFNEPAGLCFDSSEKFLFVSDTNNHSIQIVDMNTLLSKPFNLNFSQILQQKSKDVVDTALAKKQIKLNLPLNTYKTLKLRVSIKLQGYKFTTDAPQKWSVVINKNSILGADANNLKGMITSNGDFIIDLQSNNDSSLQQQKDNTICIDITMSLCSLNQCLLKHFALIINDSNDSKAQTTTSTNNKLITQKKEIAGDESIIIYVNEKDIVLQKN